LGPLPTPIPFHLSLKETFVTAMGRKSLFRSIVGTRRCGSSWGSLTAMPASILDRAKRALVSLLLRLASAYGVALDVRRESDEKAILQAYRRIAKKVHPDKGGTKKSFQALQAAKEAWDSARVERRPSGNPQLAENKLVLSSASSADGYRVRATAVLLTYSGSWSLPLWRAFIAWLRGRLSSWTVRNWFWPSRV
jgi:hypothetical protein